MALGKAWLCLAFLAFSSVVLADEVQDDEYADTYRAHLIVHKAVEDKSGDLSYPLVVQGRNATITVTIYNAGSGPASDVVLADALAPNAQLIEGSLSATFPKISSGSSVKNTYVVVFTSGGSLEVRFLPSATVTYKPEEDSEQVGVSSRAGVFVVTPVQQITRYALIAGTYASLGICRTPAEWRNMGIFLGIIGFLLGANWSVKAVGVRSTTTKRKKALQELEKED